MPDNIELQNSLIRGAFHGLLHTAALLCNLSLHNPENIDSLKKIYNKSREIHLFFKSPADIETKIDVEMKANLYLSTFFSAVPEIELLCRGLVGHVRQTDIVNAAETLKNLTNDLYVLIKEER